MVAVVLHFVGIDVDYFEVEPVKMGYLNIRREGGNHQSDFVAFADKFVFLYGIEGIAHTGGAAFGGKTDRMSICRRRRPWPDADSRAPWLRRCAACGRGRVLVSYDGFCEFMGQSIGVKFMFRYQIFEKCD